MRESAPRPVEYFDRYRDEIVSEDIYGEAALRWAYETPFGRLTVAAFVRRVWFSRLYGWLMDRPAGAERIAPFIEQYQLDPAEFLDPPESFASFNEFFYRKLAPGARPIDPEPDNIVFPADGRHLAIPELSRVGGFFVKGQRFELEHFLDDPALARRYRKGSLVLSRLCPVDYHRFHFPAAGTPGAARSISGTLRSVSPLALRRRLAILWENKRVLTELKTENFGTILIVEIGATNVGSTLQTYAPGEPVAKGDEKGFFRFGGSAVATLFEPGALILAPDLLEHSARHLELYARMGDVMAVAR
ncbi:MAG: phosphatidylserine decarboxylase [Verrucomicrobiales bacterium]